MLAVLKKYGADEEVIEEDFRKRWLGKKGVDIGTRLPRSAEKWKILFELVQEKDWQPTGDGLAPPVLPELLGLLQEVLSARIKDEAGFFEACARVSDEANYPPHLTKLEGLKVTGETATGYARETIYDLRAGPGKSKNNKWKVERVKYHFRKWKGGWLIEE